MAEITHPSDAIGLQLVIDKLKETQSSPYTFLAAELKISRQAVHSWKAVPLRFVGKVEKLTGIPRTKILPYALKQAQDALRN